MPNPNKIIYNGQTLLDLTSDTVDASRLEYGYTAHDASGNSVTGSLQMLLTINFSSFSSLPQTVNDSRITADYDLVRAELGTPSAQIGDWTVTTSNGSVTVSGSISGSTTLKLILGKTY